MKTYHQWTEALIAQLNYWLLIEEPWRLTILDAEGQPQTLSSFSQRDRIALGTIDRETLEALRIRSFIEGASTIVTLSVIRAEQAKSEPLPTEWQTAFRMDKKGDHYLLLSADNQVLWKGDQQEGQTIRNRYCLPIPVLI